MSSMEQPAVRAGIIPARLADLLQRAMSWRLGAPAMPRQDAAQSTVEAAVADIGDRNRDGLPWWAAHHPAVSFRGPQREEIRD